MTTAASRREFLRRAASLSIAGAATPWALNLAALGEAAAAGASDYKALVCVFLYGGNDYANTLVPYDNPSHTAYLSHRAAIALPRDSLQQTVLAPATPLADGRQYALAPGLAPLKPIFDGGQMSVLLNIGTLVQPTSKQAYANRSVPLPPKLFSHNDQQSVWQSSSPEGSTSGWGGRIGDLFAAGNGNSTFTCISAAGNAVYLSGHSAVQYQVTSNGSVPLAALAAPLFGSQACSDALRTLVTAPRTHLFEAEHARVMKRAIDADAQLSSALAGAPALTTPFPTGNGLAAQLSMVARLIAVRQALGAKRQVFFVSLGGFDNHDGMLTDHPGLLTTVGNALAAFHAATVELGVASNVTAFTASDFGRTLTTDGDGSDHGWGSMHFVLGGAVRGRSYVGTAPVIANNGPDDVGQGRLLPAIAVDQFAATLSSWFGVSDGEMPTVLPNIGNYSQRNLGFLG
ncbi:DUF1501 domain-containing protein [Piscinibacter sakaiensis]|uniref:DUF1501 domain-containing protein n=1 Tax=Piscinibacter sakaiensis TaxID=1547922 RepID=UPI003AB0E59B